jgi:hypothetical protein
MIRGVLFAALVAAPAAAGAGEATITVRADRPVGGITPWMTGACIEDV